jgi:hypothetical protein
MSVRGVLEPIRPIGVYPLLRRDERGHRAGSTVSRAGVGHRRLSEWFLVVGVSAILLVVACNDSQHSAPREDAGVDCDAIYDSCAERCDNSGCEDACDEGEATCENNCANLESDDDQDECQQHCADAKSNCEDRCEEDTNCLDGCAQARDACEEQE